MTSLSLQETLAPKICAPGKPGSMGKEVAGDHLEIREWNPAGASPAQLTSSQQAGSESCMAMG